MALFDYQKEIQRLMRDQDQGMFNTDDLTNYINRSRRQVAMQAQCVRVLPPIAGQVVQITVTAGGTGYVNPTVSISSPDSPTGAQLYPQGAQATASATVNGGVITDIQVNFGGDGYFQPTVTITDSAGTGATATASVTPINITVQGQEIYPFSQVPLQNAPGVKNILNVRSISVLFANWRYSCLRYPFNMFQSYIRRYPQNYMYVPEVCAQYGQGESGSIYGYPIANAAYQWEWDCICQPLDLTDDQTVEAIPGPWTDAVVFMAMYYALTELANYNASRFWKGEYDDFIHRYSAAARPGGVAINPYGRV